MKVVYMGTPDFAVGALESIIEAGHDVALAVTQPDKPKGRGKEMAMSPVKECALQYHIPVLTPVKIKAAEAVEELKQYPADIFVVAAFGQILSEEILDKIIAYINEHAYEPLHVKDIATALNLNVKYIQRLFIDKVGRTPKDYIMEIFEFHKYRAIQFLFNEVAVVLAKDEYSKGLRLLELIDSIEFIDNN